MTDSLPILRETLAHAQTHRTGLQAINDQLRALHTGDVGAFVTMDAVDAVDALISSIRFAIERVEESQRQDTALDAQMRELGIDPDEFDDEDDEPDDPVVLPEWAQKAVMMMGGVSPLAMQMLASPLSYRFRRQAEPSPACYEASWGWVHSRPSCRCRR